MCNFLLSGNKEAIDVLHKCNHTISYHDIRMQNIAWSRMVSLRQAAPPSLRKGAVTHSTLDNNDGRQETWTGKGTTHDTNKTVFQLLSKEEESIDVIGVKERCLDISEEYVERDNIPAYHPGKRVGPAVFPRHVDIKARDAVLQSLKENIAWSAAGSLTSNNEELPLLGSWTPFKKATTNHVTNACVQEYLPVTPHPPEYPVCKDYLDLLLQMIEELEIPHIFVHSDELVYSKLCDIVWKNKDLYQKLILLMGGFHQLRVMQRLIYKRHYCRGFRDWCVDSGVIADGSADSAFEGRHYFRCMRVNKECFDALVQYRIEQLTGKLQFLSNTTTLKVFIFVVFSFSDSPCA